MNAWIIPVYMMDSVSTQTDHTDVNVQNSGREKIVKKVKLCSIAVFHSKKETMKNNTIVQYLGCYIFSRVQNSSSSERYI